MPASLVVAERVRDLAIRLERTDLRPAPEVNAAFEELVGLTLSCRGATAADVLQLLGSHVEGVRELCAIGEAALEAHWSERIASSCCPRAELEGFPYLENYRDLVALEVAVVAGVGGRPRRAVMIGSGPLPLTGVMLACDHDMEVVLVDRDPVCLQQGDALARSLGLGPWMSSVQADVSDQCLHLAGTDLVVTAAMVGRNGSEKRAVLANIGASMRVGAHLVVRSAAGLRQLLYPPATIDGIDGLAMLLELHPHHDVVNSVLVARRGPT